MNYNAVCPGCGIRFAQAREPDGYIDVLRCERCEPPRLVHGVIAATVDQTGCERKRIADRRRYRDITSARRGQ